MKINVRLYSVARHRDGKIIDQMTLELPDGSHADDVLAALKINEELEPIVSINNVIAYENSVLHEDDEVSVIPSVAGG